MLKQNMPYIPKSFFREFMLNRKACRLCVREYVKREMRPRSMTAFMESFARMWRVELCTCPHCKGSPHKQRTYREPPENCPYLLEHMMHNG
jgi:hypothetical protein